TGESLTSLDLLRTERGIASRQQRDLAHIEMAGAGAAVAGGAGKGKIDAGRERCLQNGLVGSAVDGLPCVGDREPMGLRGAGHADAHAIAAWRREGTVRTELNCGTYQDTDGKRTRAYP